MGAAAEGRRGNWSEGLGLLECVGTGVLVCYKAILHTMNVLSDLHILAYLLHLCINEYLKCTLIMLSLMHL